MKIFTVRYEIELFPSHVIVELPYKDRLEAYDAYEQRLNNHNCKKVEIIESGESQEKDENISDS